MATQILGDARAGFYLGELDPREFDANDKEANLSTMMEFVLAVLLANGWEAEVEEAVGSALNIPEPEDGPEEAEEVPDDIPDFELKAEYTFDDLREICTKSTEKVCNLLQIPHPSNSVQFENRHHLQNLILERINEANLT